MTKGLDKRLKAGLDSLTDFELGYLAGIIDGEGTIGLSHTKDNRHCQPYVQISNNSQVLMEWLRAHFGRGYQTKVHRNTKWDKASWNTSYRWDVSSMLDVLYLVETVKPCLVFKKPQAEIVSDYIYKRLEALNQPLANMRPDEGRYLRRTTARTPIPQEVFKLVEKIEELNHNNFSNYTPKRVRSSPP